MTAGARAMSIVDRIAALMLVGSAIVFVIGTLLLIGLMLVGMLRR